MFATPIPLEISVREARDIYLRDNGFTIEGYTAPHVDFPVGPGRCGSPTRRPATAPWPRMTSTTC